MKDFPKYMSTTTSRRRLLEFLWKTVWFAYIPTNLTLATAGKMKQFNDPPELREKGIENGSQYYFVCFQSIAQGAIAKFTSLQNMKMQIYQRFQTFLFL